MINIINKSNAKVARYARRVNLKGAERYKWQNKEVYLVYKVKQQGLASDLDL